MIRKRLRVSSGWTLPILAALVAAITAAAFAVGAWVTSTLYDYEILSELSSTELLVKIGWAIRAGSMVVFFIFTLLVAKRSLISMTFPALAYAVGLVIENFPKMHVGELSVEAWVVVVMTVIYAWLFIMVVTNTLQAKEPVIILGLIALAGIAVLTVMHLDPFYVSREVFGEKLCLAITDLVRLAGFYIASMLFIASLENMFRAEVDVKNLEADAGKDPNGENSADSGETENKTKTTKTTKSEDRKAAKAEGKAAKSDGNTVNWALLRPTTEGGEKKPSDEEPEKTESDVTEEPAAEPATEPAAEIFGAEESVEDSNRKIAELTESEPTFEEEMNLLDEIETTRPAAEPVAAAADASAVITAEDGVEIVQYSAPVQDDTPAEEKTLAQLLAERGLAGRKSELFDEPFDDSPEADYSTPIPPTYRPYQPAEETEETAEVVTDAVETVAEAAAFGGETAEEAAAFAGETFAAAEAKASDVAEDAVETIGSFAADFTEEASDPGETVSEIASDTAATAETVASEAAEDVASATEDIFGREEKVETVKEPEPQTEFTEKNRKRDAAARIRTAAEKVSSGEPELTIPVTPIPGSRLQKVLKEEIVTDRDQQLMQRRRVSAFAVIGMIISVAAIALGLLTTFKVIELEALKNEQTCIMIFGFGLLGFLMAGTRLFYKEYYTKTVLNERKVTHEESNWEEYVANRLEEDEKNIATLAENYMRMTEMYGHLLETTAELTNNIKALSARTVPSLTAAEEPAPEVPVAATPAAEEPLREAFAAEEPAADEFAAEEPAAETVAETIEETEPEAVAEEPAYEAPASEEVAYEEPAYEAPAYEAPASEEAAYEEPAYETPAYEAPASEAPVFEGPAYDEAAFAEGEPAYYTEETSESEAAETYKLPDPASLMTNDDLPYETEPVAEAVETVAEEAVKTAEEPAAEVLPETKTESLGGASANAAILSSLFSGKWSKNRKEEPEVKKEEPVAQPVVETKPAEEASEAPKTGNYNEYLINSMFGRKPAKTTPVAEAVEEVAEAAEETVAEVAGTVEETAEEAVETAEEVATEAAEEATETVTEAVEEATETAEEATETVTEAVEEATETAEEAFGEVAEETEKAAEETAEIFPNYVMPSEEAPSYATETAAMTDAFANVAPETEDDGFANAFVPSSEGDSWQTVKPLFGQFGYGSLASGENDTTFTESYGTVPTYDTTPATSSGSGDDAETPPWAVAEEPAYTEPETYTEPEAYTEPETYTEPEAYTATETYTAPETDTEPETYTAPEAATEPEEEPAAYEPQPFQNIVPETVTETAEAAPEAAEPEVKRPAYRPSIYGTDVLVDENAGDEMPTVHIPAMVTQAQEEPEAPEEPEEAPIMPTFTGVTDFSDAEQVDKDDAAEDMYNGSYRSKYLSSLRSAKNDRKKQFFFDDDDEFDVGGSEGVFHGAEVPPMPATAEEEPQTEEPVEADGMFAEPDLPMTELDFAEPELPEEAPAFEEEAPAEAPAAPAAPAAPDPVEDERAKLEARRKMLQERLDQIRKKNQMNQFDDLSDLDDEGVFFHK
ncbi:MAG: hypothetical protein K6E71_00090 [Lachnospiraceae bacterium]|nr:hypothetical protein [Lachnospiraceae bacterium]